MARNKPRKPSSMSSEAFAEYKASRKAAKEFRRVPASTLDIVLTDGDKLAISANAAAKRNKQGIRSVDIGRVGTYARSSAMFKDVIEYLYDDNGNPLLTPIHKVHKHKVLAEDPRRVLWMQAAYTKGGTSPREEYDFKRSNDSKGLSFKRGAIHKRNGSQLSVKYPGHHGPAYDRNTVAEWRGIVAAQSIGLETRSAFKRAIAATLRRIDIANGDSMRRRIVAIIKGASGYFNLDGYSIDTVQALQADKEARLIRKEKQAAKLQRKRDKARAKRK